jgi:hypothetical protein
VHGSTCGLLVKVPTVALRKNGETIRFRFSYIGGSPGNVKTV